MAMIIAASRPEWNFNHWLIKYLHAKLPQHISRDIFIHTLHSVKFCLKRCCWSASKNALSNQCGINSTFALSTCRFQFGFWVQTKRWVRKKKKIRALSEDEYTWLAFVWRKCSLLMHVPKASLPILSVKIKVFFVFWLTNGTLKAVMKPSSA